MIHSIAKIAEDQTGLKYFRTQIKRDLETGLVNPEQAEDLLRKVERVRGYAGLQVILLAVIIIRRTLLYIPPIWLNTLMMNGIISCWPALDRRVDFKHLHSPGVMLVRCIPGCGIVATNIALLRAEPALHDVALRFCEHAYRRMHLSFLIHVFVRPSMSAIRRLNNLNWPQP